ncbi:uncharacterized protein JCM15063_005692 [Sporobolomyces koalae]|uniref:uncharacterized protein n=1 Tax=Sporobolomyces koalae TaxID=500713 RepID=UPI00316B5D9B
MLNQTDMVRYLSVEPPPEQHIVFSILHAYVFSKSRRGNLPSETLSKLLSIQRKLMIQRGGKPFSNDHPVARAFEAMRIQMLVVNKKWMVEGVSAFGPLGAIGATGNSTLAIEAWRKATDNKVKQFPSTSGDGAMGWGVPGGPNRIVQELDAGRVIGPGFTDSADPRTTRRDELDLDEQFDSLPPGYDGPPPAADDSGPDSNPPRQTPRQDAAVVEAMNDRMEGRASRPESLTASESGRTTTTHGGAGSVSPPPLPPAALPPARNSIEAGVSELARLRALKEERDRAEEEEERNRRI